MLKSKTDKCCILHSRTSSKKIDDMLFSKKNRRPRINKTSLLSKLDVLAVKNGRLLSAFLQRKTSRFNSRQLKIGCFVFLAVFTAGSISIVINSLTHPSVSVPLSLSNHSRSNLPRVEDKMDDITIRPTIERIESFHHRLDSLRNDPTGRIFYDSLKLARPGLFDSLARVEQIYRVRR
jgi:hypothetical protein